MWQWYIQPPGRSSGSQAIRTRPRSGTLTVSSQLRVPGWAAVDVQDLEEEAMQVEWMVHLRVVDDFPDLHFAGADRLGSVVHLLVDEEVDPPTQAAFAAEVNRAGRDGVGWRQWLDPTQRRGDPGPRGAMGPDLDRGVPQAIFLDHATRVRQPFQGQFAAWLERADREVYPIPGCEQHLGCCNW